MLALPMRRPGTDEADSASALDNSRSLARFAVEELEVSDSNANSNNSAFLQVGQLRLRLMRKRDVTDAYTTLDVIQVMECRADNQLVLQRHSFRPCCTQTPTHL